MLKLAADIETRLGYITCIGFAWSGTEAICIPFTCREHEEGYWSREEEIAIVAKIKELLTHPNVAVAGQNWHYDAQYIARHWGFIVEPKWLDTMLAQHVCFPGLPKTLDFISSLYCADYRYWKDDGKEASAKLDDDQLWSYNCDDNVYTYEDALALEGILEKMDMREQYDRLMRKWLPILRTMLRGMKIDMQLRTAFASKLQAAKDEIAQWITDILGHPLNPNSPKQMVELFYGDFNLKPRKNKQGGITCDKNALAEIAAQEPVLRPLVEAIELYRTLGIFLSTFVLAGLDWDGRIRCMYGMGGTETFRLNSKEDVFGFGTNLQNIPANRGD